MGGKKIKELREKNQKTQAYLADIIGSSQQNVSKIENQSQLDISSRLLDSIASYFGVTTDYLLDRTEEYNDFPYYDVELKEIAAELAPEDLRLWIEMGVRLAGEDFEKRMLKRHAEKQKGKKK